MSIKTIMIKTPDKDMPYTDVPIKCLGLEGKVLTFETAKTLQKGDKVILYGASIDSMKDYNIDAFGRPDRIDHANREFTQYGLEINQECEIVHIPRYDDE